MNHFLWDGCKTFIIIKLIPLHLHTIAMHAGWEIRRHLNKLSAGLDWCMIYGTCDMDLKIYSALPHHHSLPVLHREIFSRSSYLERVAYIKFSHGYLAKKCFGMQQRNLRIYKKNLKITPKGYWTWWVAETRMYERVRLIVRRQQQKKTPGKYLSRRRRKLLKFVHRLSTRNDNYSVNFSPSERESKEIFINISNKFLHSTASARTIKRIFPLNFYSSAKRCQLSLPPHLPGASLGLII